jgi:hypothetical protein
VTRYVADFLGISHLIKSETNHRAKYTENEIYQHITNCQVFLSYNIDETKMLKRRQAYKDSMNFLFELTKSGSISEANRWAVTKLIRRGLGTIFCRREKNPMRRLGLEVATTILKTERSAGKAAAVLLIVALDSAYNSVLAVSSSSSRAAAKKGGRLR